MAPTFYHDWPVPRKDPSESVMPGGSVECPRWLVVFLILVLLGLSAALIVFAVKANSKACKDGLLAEQECHNVTRLLGVQVTQTREALLRTQAQAATCNETVVSLLDSLEVEKAQGLEQLAKGEKLRGEIEELKQKLQSALAEVERLRKGNEASSKDKETMSASSSKALSPFVVAVHLLLGLGALLA